MIARYSTLPNVRSDCTICINQHMTLMIAITASGRDHYARFGPCLVLLQIYPVDDLLGFQTGSCMGSSRQQ